MARLPRHRLCKLGAGHRASVGAGNGVGETAGVVAGVGTAGIGAGARAAAALAQSCSLKRTSNDGGRLSAVLGTALASEWPLASVLASVLAGGAGLYRWSSDEVDLDFPVFACPRLYEDLRDHHIHCHGLCVRVRGANGEGVRLGRNDVL